MILLWLVTLFVVMLVGYVLGFRAKNGDALDKMYLDGFAAGRKNLREINEKMDAFYDRVERENAEFKVKLLEDIRTGRLKRVD